MTERCALTSEVVIVMMPVSSSTEYMPAKGISRRLYPPVGSSDDMRARLRA